MEPDEAPPDALFDDQSENLDNSLDESQAPFFHPHADVRHSHNDWMIDAPEPEFKIQPDGLLATADGHIVVPKEIKPRILNRFHNHKLAGHLGMKKSLNRIRSKYFWPKMVKEINAYVRACKICAMRKSHGSTRAPLQPVPLPQRLWQVISVDIIGPINPPSANGMVYILTIVENLSRYTFAIPLPDQTAATIAAALINTIILEHGVPEQIVSDRSTNFCSELLAELAKQLGIRQIKTTAYHPQADGVTEARNKLIVDILASLIQANPTQWCIFIKYVTFAINTAVHATLKDTPFYILFGRDAREPGDPHEPTRYKLASDINEIFAQQWRQAIDLVRESQLEAQANQKRLYDRGTRLVHYNVGDQVLLKKQPNTPGKFAPRWVGPYVITEALQNAVNYKIKHPETNKEDVIHVNRIKKFFSPEEPRASDSGYGNSLNSDSVPISSTVPPQHMIRPPKQKKPKTRVEPRYNLRPSKAIKIPARYQT